MRIKDMDMDTRYSVQDDRLAQGEWTGTGAEIIAALAELYVMDWRNDDAVKACNGDPMQDETDYQIVGQHAPNPTDEEVLLQKGDDICHARKDGD